MFVDDILRGNELFYQSKEYLIEALNQSKYMNDSSLLLYVYKRWRHWESMTAGSLRNH